MHTTLEYFFFCFGTSQRLSLPRKIWKRSLTLPAAAQTRRVGLTARAPRYAPLGSMGNLLGEVSGCVRGASRPVFRRQRVQSSKILYETSPNAHTRIRRIPTQSPLVCPGKQGALIKYRSRVRLKQKQKEINLICRCILVPTSRIRL